MKKEELLALNRPTHVGCAVLELSKIEMYKFHYDFIKNKCKNLYYYLLTQIVYVMKLIKIFIK